MAKVANYTQEIMQKIAAGDWTAAQRIREDALASMTENINKAISGYSYSDYTILTDALGNVQNRVQTIANTTAGK